MRHGEARELEHRRHGEVEGTLEHLDRRVGERVPLVAAARAIDDDVEAAQLVDSAVDQPRQLAEVVDVGRVSDRPASFRLHLLGDAFDVGGRASRDRDRGSRSGERTRDAFADALSSAGDQRDSSVQ